MTPLAKDRFARLLQLATECETFFRVEGYHAQTDLERRLSDQGRRGSIALRKALEQWPVDPAASR